VIAPEPALIHRAIAELNSTPFRFEFDIVMMPSTDLEMKENPTMKDASWVGLVIYENDIVLRPEPERVVIGQALHNARGIIKAAGFRCEYYPLPGSRKDYNLDNGIPVIGTKTSMDNKPE
jgi:hypothetical protein